MEIILIRHTSVAVPKGTCYGWSDVPVAETFEAEAATTKNNLLQYGKMDAVFSSPLTRAMKLAKYCGYDSPVVDDRLKEMNMGDWEMQRYDEIKDDRLEEWYYNYMTMPATNGESFPMIYQRVSDFLNELKNKNYQRVAIFTHGGVLICAGIYGGLFSTDHAFDHLTGYGGIEKIMI